MLLPSFSQQFFYMSLYARKNETPSLPLVSVILMLQTQQVVTGEGDEFARDVDVENLRVFIGNLYPICWTITVAFCCLSNQATMLQDHRFLKVLFFLGTFILSFTYHRRLLIRFSPQRLHCVNKFIRGNKNQNKLGPE